MSVNSDYKKLKELEQQRKKKLKTSKQGLNNKELEQQRKEKTKFSRQRPNNNIKTKGIKKRGAPNSVKGMYSAGKQVKNAISAFHEVDLSRDIFYLLVIVFSFLADLLTLIPVVGNIFAIMFSAIIWVFYLFSGNLGRRRIAIVIVAQLIEILLPGVSALPFFTISALVVYWLVLIDRKGKERNQQIRKNKQIQ